MKLTPVAIKRQEFKKVMKGFDKDEVQTFLEKVADDYEILLNENSKLKDNVKELEQTVEQYKKMEKNLQDAMLNAQDSKNKELESAKKQAALIIREAELKANQLTDKTKVTADTLRGSVINLREEKNLIIAKLKAIVYSQAHLLEVKVKDAGEEPSEMTKPQEFKKLDLDINNIVDNLLE